MSTFQSVVYGLLHGFTEILPLGGPMLRGLLGHILDWPTPTGALLGAMYLATALACFGQFLDDWASMISSCLRILFYRRRPMTLDERMPFFLLLATLPALVAYHYLSPRLAAEAEGLSPFVLWGGFAAAALPLSLVESLGRKSKRTVDLNILDSVLIGITHLLWFLPAAGRTESILLASLFRNFDREASLKIAFYCAFPVLLQMAIPLLRTLELAPGHAMPQEGVSWITLSAAFFVTFFAAWLAVGGLMKRARKAGFGSYWATRIVAGLGAIAYLWYRNRG